MIERTQICKYAVVIGSGEFCGNPEIPGNPPCMKVMCKLYKPLM